MEADPSDQSDIGFMTDTFILLEFDGGSRVVHKDLICRFSTFFSNAFNGSFKEGHEQRVAVEASPELIADFMKWLYCPQSPPRCKRPEVDFNQKRAIESSPDADAQIDLYIFAEGYDIPLLQRACMKDLIGREPIPSMLFARDAHKISVNLPETDPLYRYLVYLYAMCYESWNWQLSPLGEQLEQAMPAMFWLAVTRLMVLLKEQRKAKKEGSADETSIKYKRHAMPSWEEFFKDEQLGRPPLSRNVLAVGQS